MDKLKDDICLIKKIISDEIMSGVNTKNISEIACIIQDIKVIEDHWHEFSNPYSSDDVEWLFASIEDEFSDAEKYCKRWKDTGDATYKAIGRDELKHAEQLVAQLRPKVVSDHDKMKLQKVTMTHGELVAKLA